MKKIILLMFLLISVQIAIAQENITDYTNPTSIANSPADKINVQQAIASGNAGAITAEQWGYGDNLNNAGDLSSYPNSQQAIVNKHPGFAGIDLTQGHTTYKNGVLTNGKMDLDLNNQAFRGIGVKSLQNGGFELTTAPGKPLESEKKALYGTFDFENTEQIGLGKSSQVKFENPSVVASDNLKLETKDGSMDFGLSTESKIPSGLAQIGRNVAYLEKGQPTFSGQVENLKVDGTSFDSLSSAQIYYTLKPKVALINQNTGGGITFDADLLQQKTSASLKLTTDYGVIDVKVATSFDPNKIIKGNINVIPSEVNFAFTGKVFNFRAHADPSDFKKNVNLMASVDLARIYYRSISKT